MIAYGGEVLRLKDTNGVRFLEYLLRHPSQPVSALEIYCGVVDGDAANINTADGDRTLPDRVAHERARVNVTRALFTTLKRVAEHHPELARHLKATLRTGTCCVYTPDPRVPIGWER